MGTHSAWGLHGAKNVEKQSVLLKAQDVSNDSVLDVIVARGNVQISNGIQTVEADTVTYNKKMNQLTASGNVKVFDVDGDVISSNYAELSDDLRDVFLKEAYMYTMDKERLAASTVKKVDQHTYFDRGVYTPCEMCKEQQYPTWQLQAKEIHRDEEKGDVIYKDAVFVFKGVPTVRTPYFSHPDPSVKRRSGFLAPFFGGDSLYGAATGVPYYWAISPAQELIVTPVLMTKQTPVLMGDYRQRFQDSIFHFSGSATQSPSVSGTSGATRVQRKRTQGHFVADGHYDATPNWRLSYDIKKASNPTYLKRYQFIERGQYTFDNNLTSTVAAEGFYGKDYVGVKGYDFQTLRPDVRRERIPTVVPMTTYQYVGNPGTYGQYWTLDADQLSLRREEGSNVQRLSSTAKLALPYTSSNGHVFDLDASLRADAYRVTQFTPFNSSHRVNNTVGRALPLTSLNWRMPFVNRNHATHWILEPRTGVVLSPVRHKYVKIPNEDSLDFEYDVNKLFLNNRLPGLDVLDTGQRANYGLNLEGYNPQKLKLKAFLGQSHSFSKTNGFNPRSGIQKGKSDYLGRFQISPHPWLDAYSDFRWHYKNFGIRRNLTSLRVGPEVFNATVNYLHINDFFDRNTYTNRQQVSGALNSQFTDHWGAFIGTSRELKPKRSQLAQSMGVIYRDDCFTFKTELLQTFYRDRDIKPATTIMFTLTLKNLGEYSTGRLKASGFSSTQDQTQREKEDTFLGRPAP
jgi:LPS-assembly protein